MIHSVYWWHLLSHQTALSHPISRPITYSLHFWCTSSGCYTNRHDEKPFSWLVMHSFPSVIVGFAFWLHCQCKCARKKNSSGIFLMGFIGRHDNQLLILICFAFSHFNEANGALFLTAIAYTDELSAMTIRAHSIILLNTYTIVRRCAKLIFHSDVSLLLRRGAIKCHTSNNCQTRKLMPELEFTMLHHSSIIHIPALCFSLSWRFLLPINARKLVQ